VVNKWRHRVSTDLLTAENCASYVEHNKTLYAPVWLVSWHERLEWMFVSFMLCFAICSAVGTVMAWRSDAIGHRWFRRKAESPRT